MGAGLFLFGCGGTKVLTITFPKSDGNSEYWVCDRDATHCRGRTDHDVDDLDYKPGMDSLSPPIECPHGAARMDVVIKGNRVLRIGYECAQPQAPTTLPGQESSGDGEGSAGLFDAPTGLPEAPLDPVDAPTGLPEEPAGPSSAEQTISPSETTESSAIGESE